MKTVALYTLGCKVAQYETEAIAEGFEALDFRVVPFDEVADVYVINTCTVTAESDSKSRRVIRRAIKKNPHAIVMVTGCYSQTSADEVLKIDGVSYVGGTDRKMRLPHAAVALLEKRRVGEAFAPVCDSAPLTAAMFEPMTVKHAPRTRAYVKIEDGCECRCTYCAIPGARGDVRSKLPNDVISEVKFLAESGTREIVLTGIEIASYGADLDGFRLIDLLEMLDAAQTGVRFRLGSITPEIMREEFVSRMSRLSCIVPHFHISMQSGSNAVLRGMKRRYTAEMALDALSCLRRYIPGVRFTTDMMTGFPGEGETEFLETLAFTRKANFLDMHIFAYSRRKNTPAATYSGQVEERVKKERSARLIALAAELREGNLSEMIAAGKPLSVLFETRDGGYMTGHSAEYAEVRTLTDEALHGEIRRVLPTHAENGILYGTLLCD